MSSAKPRRLWRTIAFTAVPSLAAGLLIAAWLAPPPQPDPANYKFTPLARDEAEELFPEWSPDGQGIVYTRNVQGIYQVFTRAIEGGDAQQLTHCDKSCAFPFWSPDGATIYYTYDNSMWGIPASGGTPEKLFKGAGPVLFPDGKILFSRDGKMWVASLKGGRPQEFWWQPPPGFNAAFPGQSSPDGFKLAITGAGKLWIVPYH